MVGRYCLLRPAVSVCIVVLPVSGTLVEAGLVEAEEEGVW